MEHKFEDAMTVDKQSWGIRRNININDIYRIEELIGLIAEIGTYVTRAIENYKNCSLLYCFDFIVNKKVIFIFFVIVS